MSDGAGRGKYVLVAAIVGVIVVSDQLTKLWVQRALELHESVPVIENLFHITYVRNTGAAFSMLADRSAAFRIPFFTLVSLAAGFAILGFLRHTPPEERSVLVACAGILGGAAGNLIDRLRYGEVIDFLDLQWRGLHWPAFNVADSCITIGVALLLVHSLFARGDRGADREPLSRAASPS